MPAVSNPDLTTLRTTRHATKLYLAVYHPATMVTARVDGNHAQSDTTITLKTIVTTTAPMKHALVYFGTTAGGHERGVGHVKSLAGATLTINFNNLLLFDNDYVTILREIKPQALRCNTDDTSTLENDDEVYATENTQYKPLARMGTPQVAFLDGATASLNFWSDSTAIATGATLSSYAWDFPSGTPATSAVAGTSGAPIAVSWNTTGHYYVSLTVTDSNGKTHTGYRPVFILPRTGASAPYQKIEIRGMELSQDTGGAVLNIAVRDTADQANFPDQALCVLFAEDYYGDTLQSIGGKRAGSENIVFVGYIKSGSVNAHWYDQSVEFQVEGMGAAMASMQGDAVNLERNASPADWHQLSAMTPMRAAYHLFTEHSTVDHLCDIYLDGTSFNAEFIDLTEGGLLDQVKQIAQSARSSAGSSWQGLFYISPNPQLQPLVSRTEASVMTLTNADTIGQIEIVTERQQPEVSQIDFAALVFGTQDDDVFSLAPQTPYPTKQVERVDNIRVTSQSDSNITAGMYEGWRNNRYPNVIFHMRGNYRVFDCFPHERFVASIATTQNNRGIVLTNAVFYPTRVSYDYRPGILLVSVDAELSSVGLPGVDGDYTTSITLPPTPPPLPWTPPTPPTPPPVTIPQGKGNLLYVSTLKGLAKCTAAYGMDGTDGTPVWTNVSGTLAGDALKIRWFDLDPWSQVTDMSGTHFTAGYAMTDDGFYRVTGLPSAPVWTQILSGAAATTLIGGSTTSTAFQYAFAVSVLTPGVVAVVMSRQTGAATYPPGGNGNQHFVIRSSDYGANWTCNTAHYTSTSGIDFAFAQKHMWVGESFHVLDTRYVTARGQHYLNSIDGVATDVFDIAKEVGGVFSDALDTGLVFGTTYPGIWIPYADASGTIYANDNTLYLYGGGAAAGLYRVTGAFTAPSWNLIYTNVPEFVFTHMFDEDNGISIGYDNGAGYTAHIAFSQNLTAGVPTWNTILTPFAIAGRSVKPRYPFIVPVDPNVVFWCGDGIGANHGAVYHTTDFGTTWYNDDLIGAGGSLTNTLGLGANDMDFSQIIVDYYQV